MILVCASRYCIAAALAFAATHAHADVMELDENGARWVAGGSTVLAGASVHDDMRAPDGSDAEVIFAVLPDTLMSNPQGVNLDGLIIPDQIIGNVADHAAAIPPQYAAKIAELSLRFDLSPSLLEALVWQESRWRANAVSHAGARGLAQLMPATARYLGVDPDDPMQNLEGGARYLREQLDLFDGDLEKALAAYNAGPGRVIRAGGIPNIRETQNYVAAIMGRLSNHSRPNYSGRGAR